MAGGGRKSGNSTIGGSWAETRDLQGGQNGPGGGMAGKHRPGKGSRVQCGCGDVPRG